MLTGLYIYLGIGVLFMWATIEMGNKEAKKKGITFRQYMAEETEGSDPSVVYVLSSMLTLTIILVVFWLPAIIINVVIARKE